MESQIANMPIAFQPEKRMAPEEAAKYIRVREIKQFSLQGPRRDLEPQWRHFPEGAALVYRAADAAQRMFLYGNGAPYLLTSFDLEDLLLRSNGQCELSGIPFSDESVPGCKRRPFIPSIDRINPKEPYRFENCRLVCWAVNRALSDWGDDVFWRIVRAASERI